MVGFIADFFDITGGAEKNDAVLLEYLEKTFKIKRILSTDCDPQQLAECDALIIGNFVLLSEENKRYIQGNKNYIIYEHDHKYVSTRDPSRFKDFKIPKTHIINSGFYRGAKKVVCLSRIQASILRENLLLDNVISIGTSLWSLDALEYIRGLNQRAKKVKVSAIVDSKNPIKNTQKARLYCEKKNIKYELIKSENYKSFLEKLSHFETLVFLPGVLESLCRLVVEAKMLNCKVVTTPRLLGAASEEWFSLSGSELISEIKKKTLRALTLFGQLVENIITPREESITAILTCYRRPEYLLEQIEALRAQTIPPKEIWVWVNHHEENMDFDFNSCKADRVFQSGYNWKFHGRFAAAQLCRTKYVAMFDDDTIPGRRWLENCVQNIETQNLKKLTL